MRVIISKYALTSGLYSVDASPGVSPGMVYYRVPGSMFEQYAHGNDFHDDESEAIARADEMREKKILSLKKQIAKLEKMTFKVKNL